MFGVERGELLRGEQGVLNSYVPETSFTYLFL